MSSSSSSYTKPQWARAPQHNNWTLTEIKGGVEQAVHKLDRSCTLLGRAADQVDIALQHESASRQHARIAFDSAGTPWLRDLQSTHGVTVNKKRLPEAAIGKSESSSTKAGSRGVVLYPGDVLQFGASTRIYCVDGPAEFARGAIRKVEPKVSSSSGSGTLTTAVSHQPDAKHHQEAEHSEGVSWGIETDDFPSGESSSDRLDLLTDDKIPEKHFKEWERIKALRIKLHNIQSESERIRVKANSAELSTGQERQLERNDERISKLQEQISDREAELHRKLYPQSDQSASTKAHRASHEVNGDEEDVDDFYDRTKQHTSNQLELDRDGETEESLIAKWKTLREQRRTALANLDRCKQKVVQLEQRVAYLKSKGDEESFFAQNDLDLAKDSMQKTESQKQSLDKMMTEAEELLRIANGDLTPNRETGRIHRKGEVLPDSTKGDEHNDILRPQARDADASKNNTTGTVAAGGTLPDPRVTPVGPHHAVLPSPSFTRAGSDNFSIPPPNKKRQRVVGPSLMPPPPSTSTMDTIFPSPRKAEEKKARQPVVGTLAVLSQMTSTSTEASSLGSAKIKESKAKEATVASATKCNNGKEDVWQAPKDQDGSGITKLNAKFRGRY